MTVTRLLRALLLGSLSVALAACQSSPWGAAPGARVQRILSGQELRVGLTASQPPLNVKNARGEVVGLEVDVVNALAQSMGVKPRLVVMPFADLLPALERGEVDMVISGMTITPDRNARVAFAGPYFISGKSLLTKDAGLADLKDLEALNDSGHTLAALAGSTSERFVRDVAPKAKLVASKDYGQAVEMVMDGRADALVADFPICKVSTLRYPDAGLRTPVTPFTAEPLGIALPADDPLLVNLVENYLTTLERTGELTQFKARWFSYGTWVSELP